MLEIIIAFYWALFCHNPNCTHTAAEHNCPVIVTTNGDTGGETGNPPPKPPIPPPPPGGGN